MRNFFKSIAIATIVGVLFLTNISIVMAAEPTQEVVSTENDNSVESRSTLVATYYYEGSLTQGKRLFPVNIELGRPTKLDYNISGSSGNVTVKLVHRDTGESRSFTAVGKGEWGSITYVSPMPTGIWDVTVLLVSGSGHDSIALRFYR